MSDQTCEYMMTWEPTPKMCGKPTAWRYPASGGGYMHLCEEHAQRHLTSAAAIGMERVR